MGCTKKKDLQRDRRRCTAHTIPFMLFRFGGVGTPLSSVRSGARSGWGTPCLVTGPVTGPVGVPPVHCQVWCQVRGLGRWVGEGVPKSDTCLFALAFLHLSDIFFVSRYDT